MALNTIRDEVILALAQTNEQIRDAKSARARGADAERVAAAGELEFLRRQKIMLLARLIEVDRRMAAHQTLFSWFRQEWFNLRLQIESWIVHG
jgi:hypothetical protein